MRSMPCRRRDRLDGPTGGRGAGAPGPGGGGGPGGPGAGRGGRADGLFGGGGAMSCRVACQREPEPMPHHVVLAPGLPPGFGVCPICKWLVSGEGWGAAAPCPG